MATRLLAIVLLPMLGVAGFAGSEGLRVRNRAEQASAVEHAMEKVAVRVRMDLVINERLFLQAAMVVGAGYGLDGKATGNLLGIDIPGRMAAGDQAIREVRAEIADDPALQDQMDQILARMQTLLVTDLLVVGEEMGDILDTSATLSAEALGDADELLANADRAAALRRLASTARGTLEAMKSLGQQITWSALALGFASETDLHLALTELQAATAIHEAARSELDAITEGRIRDRWMEIGRSETAERNAQWFLDLTAQDGASPIFDELLLARAIGTAIGRMTQINALTHLTIEEAGAEAGAMQAEAQRQLQLQFVLMTLLTLGTLAGVALIARSINRPIRSLAIAAERVSTGDLDAFLLPRGGPPELRKVMSTLAEVVTNLRTVEAQVGTLAAGDLDDVILDAPVPGRLGTLLHDSVARLSASMTDREELGHRLEHEATHDPLTQLPNRVAARSTLAAALERGRRSGTAVAVLFLDLDGFKQVNDTHGHDIGDRVLAVTAERLHRALRGGDMVARIGGDEFVVVAEQAGDAYAMLELGQRLIDDVSQPITVGSIATRVGASVGVAMALDGETDPDLLLRDADLAAYRAKSTGRGRVELFDEHLRAEVARRIDVELALRHGIDRGELELYFQPVVNPLGVTQGLEALVRWNRPGHGLVPPGDFIPVAEGSDLIIDLGRWVLQNACEHLVRWADDPELRDLSVGVNLSGRHLLSLTVLDDVRSAFAATGADPRRMVIEITETVLMADLPLVVDHLEQLRHMGIKIAIDDFGTGYTSLTHLRRLPVDVIKVDRSMVVSAEQPADALVLKLLIDTVHSLGLRLIAEGVETAEQLARVEDLGCDEIQGYLFSRPVPALGLHEAMRRSSVSQS